jgi:crossover junction endodeoxyribonuclease RusA
LLGEPRRSFLRAYGDEMSEAITPIYLALPFPPSVNGIWRGGKGGRHFLSPRYKAWKQEAAQCARLQSKKHISGPYALQLNFMRPDKRIRDLGNLEKAVSDLLVECGYIRDDSEAQYIELRWVERGPPCWCAIRPCTRWATDIPQVSEQ